MEILLSVCIYILELWYGRTRRASYVAGINHSPYGCAWLTTGYRLVKAIRRPRRTPAARGYLGTTTFAERESGRHPIREEGGREVRGG